MRGTELRTPRRMHEHLAITNLGARSLSLACLYPLLQTSARTRAAQTGRMTFGPNQYKLLYQYCTPSEPNTQYQIH